ncbi:hypothetical protein HT031_002031 [Scenedesmus sp. PABB004]|nr:hypothetical protein HT031_002031 [Scenedesmus sp. PABB004]
MRRVAQASAFASLICASAQPPGRQTSRSTCRRVGGGHCPRDSPAWPPRRACWVAPPGACAHRSAARGLVNAVGYYAPSTSAGCGSSINAGPLCGGLPNRLAKRINSTRSLDQTWCTGCRDLRFFCQTSVSQAATAGIAYPAEQLCVRWADAPAKSCDSLPPPETLPPNARPWPELCLFIQDQGLCATRCKAGYTGTPTTLCDNGSWRLPAQGACVQASCDPLTTPPVNGRWPLRCRTPDKRVPLGASCTARCNNGTIPFPAARSMAPTTRALAALLLASMLAAAASAAPLTCSSAKALGGGGCDALCSCVSKSPEYANSGRALSECTDPRASRAAGAAPAARQQQRRPRVAAARAGTSGTSSSPSSSSSSSSVSLAPSFTTFDDDLEHSCDFYDWKWGSKISYVRAGRKGPPLLLVHGFGVGAYHFERNLPELSRSHRVFAIDLLGQGGSWPDLPECAESGPLRFSADTWTEQLLHFIEEKVGEPVYIAGNSLGGFLAVNLAARHPEAVKGVVLLNSTPFWSSRPPLGREGPIWRLLPCGVLPVPQSLKSLIERLWWNRIRNPSTIRSLLQLVYARPSTIDARLLDRILAATERPQALDAFASIALAPRTELSFDEMLDALTCPVCLAYGSQDPWVVPLWGQRLKRRVPSAAYLELSPVGHCPHHEAPTAVNHIITTWVAAVEAGEHESHELVQVGSQQQFVEDRLDGAVITVTCLDGSPRNAFEREDAAKWQLARALRASRGAGGGQPAA